MHCRLCGSLRQLDSNMVCTPCRDHALQNRDLRIADYYCVQCGDGPGHAHIFDEHGVCWSCRGRPTAPLVLAPPTPPVRRKVPCRGCGSGSFVRVTTVAERTIDPSAEDATEVVRPFALAFARKRMMLGTADVPIGTLEAYVCRACGLTELYTKEHDTLPIGPEWGTELFDVPGTPYR